MVCPYTQNAYKNQRLIDVAKSLRDPSKDNQDSAHTPENRPKIYKRISRQHKKLGVSPRTHPGRPNDLPRSLASKDIQEHHKDHQGAPRIPHGPPRIARTSKESQGLCPHLNILAADKKELPSGRFQKKGSPCAVFFAARRGPSPPKESQGVPRTF